MTCPVLLDTGPLVASINRKDLFHAWTLEVLGKIAPPLMTCEPVLAESCFLLKGYPGGSAAVLELVRRGVVTVDFRVEDHCAPLSKLMAKYSDVPMSLADACLVRMAELHSESKILTLDGDFRVYRRHGRQSIALITPHA